MEERLKVVSRILAKQFTFQTDPSNREIADNVAREILAALDQHATYDPSGEYTLATALEQIESCHFECEAGKLENNTAFVWLKGLVKP